MYAILVCFFVTHKTFRCDDNNNNKMNEKCIKKKEMFKVE